jgi:hypothetical protein
MTRNAELAQVNPDPSSSSSKSAPDDWLFDSVRPEFGAIPLKCRQSGKR